MTLAPPAAGITTTTRRAMGADSRPEPVAFNFSQSETFAPLLRQLGVSLLVTTYQANKLLVIREQSGGVSILVRTFERPMGVAVDGRRIALGTRDQVLTFRNAPDIAPQVEPVGTHDACFIPRSSHVTGDIGVHEIAWARRATDELWLVNTRFSCLCTLDPDYSFVPRWRPPFITAAGGGRSLPPQRAGDRRRPATLRDRAGPDRHARRMARDQVARRVGHVRAGRRVIADGLCMPHSPRWHDNALWVLESGTGRLAADRPCQRRAAGRHRRAAGLRPRAGDLRAVRVHRALEDPRHLRDGRRAARRAARAAQVRHRGRSTCAAAGVVAASISKPRSRKSSTCRSSPGSGSPKCSGSRRRRVQNTFVVPPGTPA